MTDGLQDATAKECGLHSGNVVQSAADQARDEQLPDLWPSGPVEALSRQQLAALKAGPRDKDTLVVLYAPWCQFSQVAHSKPAFLAQRALRLPTAVTRCAPAALRCPSDAADIIFSLAVPWHDAKHCKPAALS